jgi:hypothetical protein
VENGKGSDLRISFFTENERLKFAQFTDYELARAFGSQMISKQTIHEDVREQRLENVFF